MSQSAVQNLSESLDLIKCTIEAILNKEAEFQKLMAQEIALAEDPVAASACLQRQPDDGEDFVDLCGGIRRDLR